MWNGNNLRTLPKYTYFYKLNGEPYRQTINVKWVGDKKIYYTGKRFTKWSQPLEHFPKGFEFEDIQYTSPFKTWPEPTYTRTETVEEPIYSINPPDYSSFQKDILGYRVVEQTIGSGTRKELTLKMKDNSGNPLVPQQVPKTKEQNDADDKARLAAHKKVQNKEFYNNVYNTKLHELTQLRLANQIPSGVIATPRETSCWLFNRFNTSTSSTTISRSNQKTIYTTYCSASKTKCKCSTTSCKSRKWWSLIISSSTSRGNFYTNIIKGITCTEAYCRTGS